MPITTVDLNQEILDRKQTSGLSYKALIILGLDFLKNSRASNARLAELEIQVDKLNIARSKMQDRIYELTTNEKDSQPPQSFNDGEQNNGRDTIQ